ncbi:permease prefix domain 1-containing protein [Arthrobacter koreensis]|uniref:permease prefix domain 1-containing protein n=1 Tax=Arthrobacter koreensis TaxID=199136 RepID=UPI002DBF2DB0|nr:permease prefix domain 1-containing protein [Arthrobacter koreensis]MEB7504311.1 permease prefix domain 1-containing protein [Arthrobacter koreensis]
MSTLTDRYVFAALKSIPEAQRSDIERELRGSIADDVEARVEAGQPAAEAENAVLAELGDPARLAAQYSGRPLYLIGPDLFLDWWRLLKTLAVILTPLALVGSVVVQMALDPGNPAGAFGTAVGTAISVLVHLGFWVTLVFAIIQFNGTRRKDLGLQPWSPAMLPQVPRKSQVSLGDTIASVVLAAFFIGVLLWQRVGSVMYLDGEPVVLLQESLWSFWLPYVIVLLVIEAGFAVVLYLAGRWTYAFAAVNAVLALAFTVPVLWLLSTDQVFDWTFLANVDWGADVSGWISGITAAAVLFIGLWDIGDGFIKAWKSGRLAPAPAGVR